MLARLFVLRKSLEENLSAFGRSSGSAGRNKGRNVGGTRLGCGADVDCVRHIRSDSRILGPIRCFVQDNDVDSQIFIKVGLEGSVVVHVIKRLDDNRRSRGETRVAGLELQDTMVEFKRVGRMQVTKNVNDDGLRFGLRVTSRPHQY